MKDCKRKDVRYYDLNKMTTKEIAEDLVAAKEAAEEQALLDDGWIDMGTIDPYDEEAWEELCDKIASMME